jgi:hypothetical protein
MNDLDELWSLPWHALQRRLAEAYRPEATPATPAAIRRSRNERNDATAGSWLVRARSIAASAAIASR